MLNVIAVMGRLVADPESRATSTGTSMTTFRLAVDRNFVKAGSERQTDFFNVVTWRSTADFAAKYLRKGQLVAVNGSMQMRNYEDKSGNKRTSYDIVADNIHFAEPKGSGAPRDADSQGVAPGAAPRALPQEQESYSAGAPEDFAVIDDSADLPF